jgi:hypothetical protein
MSNCSGRTTAAEPRSVNCGRPQYVPLSFHLSCFSRYPLFGSKQSWPSCSKSQTPKQKKKEQSMKICPSNETTTHSHSGFPAVSVDKNRFGLLNTGSREARSVHCSPRSRASVRLLRRDSLQDPATNTGRDRTTFCGQQQRREQDGQGRYGPPDERKTTVAVRCTSWRHMHAFVLVSMIASGGGPLSSSIFRFTLF